VAVSVWYNVGSKDEPEGKTGFAHLFEHLMFGGSENAPGSYFTPMRNMGATDMNGTTWFDRTNYFETVPTPALEQALFMESDRMGYMLGAISQETGQTASSDRVLGAKRDRLSNRFCSDPQASMAKMSANGSSGVPPKFSHSPSGRVRMRLLPGNFRKGCAGGIGLLLGSPGRHRSQASRTGCLFSPGGRWGHCCSRRRTRWSRDRNGTIMSILLTEIDGTSQ
jgi:hypothetical protein